MSRTAPAQFIKTASNVAAYYGFRPLAEIRPMRRAPSFADAAAACAERFSTRPLEPVLAFYATPSPSHLPISLPEREAGEFGLQIIGSTESIGEVFILKTVSAIVSEWGGRVARVRINALGDRDSRERFKRELAGFLKRRAEELPEDERARAAADPMAVYTADNAAVRELLEEGPRPMHFLSEKSRIHFRSVLEQLEQIGIPYELDDLLVGDERGPRIVFRIDLESEDAVLLGNLGGRYDDFVGRLAGRSAGASVGASIFFRKKGADRSCFASGSVRSPKLFFIQLGTRAKLQGLEVVDMLREAGLPAVQAFDATRLAPQLEAAQRAGVSYVLIMGQREALDGTIIIRSMRNSSQTIVEVNRLPKVLKTLRV